MPKRSLDGLTETMFYVLMAFSHGEKSGIDIAAFIDEKTRGRLRIGPATLYTILGKFERENHIEETGVSGRKRTYRITQRGAAAYRQEVERLRLCLDDAEKEAHR